MQDWIAGTMAVLGTLLVLAGATLIVLRTMGITGRAAPPDDTTQATVTGTHTAPAGSRLGSAVRRLGPDGQLIGWGVVLLVLAALAAGAIAFEVSASAGTTPGT